MNKKELDIEVNVGELKFKNPIILGSSSLTSTGKGLITFAKAGCGGVVTKTLTPEPWDGNPAIRFMELPSGGDDLINCEGLPNPGYDVMSKEIEEAKSTISDLNSKLVVNYIANSLKQWKKGGNQFTTAGADCLELNLGGCPNYKPGTKIAEGYWGSTPERIGEAVEAVKDSVNIPVWVKNVEHKPQNYKAAERAGADAIVPRPPYMKGIPIDIETGKPLLGHPYCEGRLSGPLTFSFGLKRAFEIKRTVEVPVIGGCGIFTGFDVTKMIMAGVSAVQVVTAFHKKGVSHQKHMIGEIKEYMEEKGYSDLEELKGLSLKYLPEIPNWPGGH